MNLFDVYTIEELQELPDDPREAFVAFVRKAEDVLKDRTEEAARHASDEETWRFIDDERHGFMNIVVAAAKRLDITEFVDREVPEVQNWGASVWREFKADLDHYITQIMLDLGRQARAGSVPLPPKSKERIRVHIHNLRDCIDKATLSDRKRTLLHEKLAAFEAELERSRVSILGVTRVTLEVMALGSGAWQAADIVAKLVSNVMQEVAAAKAEDDETRRIPDYSPAPVMLQPPRVRAAPQQKPAPVFDGGMDDDMPF